jgi:outer membrane immunogenic protein
MKKLALASVVASLAAAAPGLASAETYVGASYAHVDGEDAAVGGLTGRLGFRGENNFGIEGEYTFGVKDTEVSGVTLELEQGFGVYGVYFMPLGENTDFFGRIGYASHEVTGSLGFISVSADVNGIAGGVGIQHFFGGGNFGVRADITRAEGDDGGLNMYGIGGVLKF